LLSPPLPPPFLTQRPHRWAEKNRVEVSAVASEGVVDGVDPYMDHLKVLLKQVSLRR
jgi:hypothetical protein